jgi:hypothetical protein
MTFLVLVAEVITTKPVSLVIVVVTVDGLFSSVRIHAVCKRLVNVDLPQMP